MELILNTIFKIPAFYIFYPNLQGAPDRCRKYCRSTKLWFCRKTATKSQGKSRNPEHLLVYCLALRISFSAFQSQWHGSHVHVATTFVSVADGNSGEF